MKSSTKFIVTLVCFCCSFCFATIGSAQSDIGEEEVLILTKDRSVYRGYLIEDEESFVKIRIQTNDTIFIPVEIIRKLRYGEDFIFHNNGKSHKVAGYFCWLNIGFGSSSNNRVYSNVEGELILGKRINPRLAAGIVFGLSTFSFDIDGMFADPIFASVEGHVRYYLSNKIIRPFVYSQIGGGLGTPSMLLEDEIGRQVKIQNGLGLNFSSKRFPRIVLSLAHNLQYLNGRTQVWGGFTNINAFDPFLVDIRSFSFWSNGIILKTGFDF